MAKLRDLRRFLDRLGKDVISARTMREFGDMTSDIIYKRVKSGFGVNDERATDPRRKKLKRLSPGYIRQRARDGVRGEFGAPRRSNLTNTGEMLGSFKVQNIRDGSFELVIPNSLRKDGKTNARVAEFVEQQGRPFFALTKDERQILVKELEDRIRRALRATLR